MFEIFSHPIVAMALMLGGLVLFHELGHFLVGRWCGVAIETFSIGFGATMFSKKIGETTYQLSWIPLGGFVKFYGVTRNEDAPAELRGRLFHEAKIWKRALIIFAGPFANFLLAFVLFWLLVMRGLEVLPAHVGDVVEGSRAQKAGILPGDDIIAIDGRDVEAWSDIERTISRNPEKELRVALKRQGQEIELSLIPESVPGISLFGSKTQIGRAGIALSYPSAVVTVTDANSIFGKMGLKTGDRIDSYVNENGSDVKILGFHDLLTVFKMLKISGRDAVEFSVRHVRVEVDKDGRSKEVVESESRRLRADLKSWPEVRQQTDRSYAQDLGILDSHLTIAIANGETATTLKPFDHLIGWNGVTLRNVFHLQELLSENLQPTANVQIVRDGKVLSVQTKLKPVETQKVEGAVTLYVLDTVMLGISKMPDPAIIQYTNPLVAAYVAIKEGYTQTSIMISSLWAIISGQVPLKALGGPIMIAKVASDSAKAGYAAFFVTMAMISINLALVNLFPIPVLDGGQLVMLGAEAIKGRPLAERTVENFHKVGFVLVMSLVVLAMYNDLSRFWKSMVGSIMGSMN